MTAAVTRAGSGAGQVQQLVNQIEQDIISGHLSQGSWLKQIDLQEKYAVSRLQIRQALEKLIEKRLVRYVARRGYHVEEFSDEQLNQQMEIRAILESAAVPSIIDRHDEDSLRQLQHYAQQMAEAVRAGTLEQQELANVAFHEALLAPCPNQELVALVVDLRRRAPVALTRRRNTLKIMKRAVAQHFKMIEFIRKKNAPALKKLMYLHNLTHLS